MYFSSEPSVHRLIPYSLVQKARLKVKRGSGFNKTTSLKNETANGALIPQGCVYLNFKNGV
jgi:hypothetical protein